MKSAHVGRSAWAGAVVVGVCMTGCGGSDAPKAWSALGTCLAGPAAAKPLVERVHALRAAQLASVGTTGKDAWPARCVTHAEAFYSATKDMALLNRTMKERFACRDDGAHCSIVADEAFLPAVDALWAAAESAKLKAEPAPGVAAPALAPPPLADAASWKSFSKAPARVVGPALNADGSALLLLAAREGNGRPRLCRLPAGFAEIQCSDASASVPELPAHSIALSRDGRGFFAVGMTEAGLAAFNLETGARSDVRGKAPHLVSDGVAVEAAAEPAPPAPDQQAPPPPAEKGFVALEVSGGKASRETKLAIEPVGTPITSGDQILYVAGQGASATLEARSFSKGRLKNVASIKGPFAGPFHTCSSATGFAAATFDGREGQNSAKATAGAGKVQFTIAFRTGESWSKAHEATLPFDRKIDSDLVCTGKGASIAWVRPTDGSVEVGRLDCNAEGCTPRVQALPGIASKWWGGVAPLGDKVLLIWRGALGETRLRVGALSELAQATDQLLFDSADFGGPVAGEPTQRSTEAATLLIFNQAQPVALRVGADGQAKLLAP